MAKLIYRGIEQDAAVARTAAANDNANLVYRGHKIDRASQAIAASGQVQLTYRGAKVQ